MDKNLKIMIVGAWQWHQYEEAFSIGLRENGVQVSKYSTSDCSKGFWGKVHTILPIPTLALFSLNRKIIKRAIEEQPDYVFFWRPTLVSPSCLVALQNLGIKTISYNNDDPFGVKVHCRAPWHHHYLWFRYLKCIPYFNLNFFYRSQNCIDAIAYGAKHVDILMPYFLPWQDSPMQLSPSEKARFSTDVVFVGHYESDNRVHDIRALVNSGVRLRIWGGHYWNRKTLGDLYDSFAPIEPVKGADYAKALCGAKICLAFLSKINRDTYTRRCFEIPACGRVMLAERTDDLMRLFKEDEEACFFSSSEEMVHKAQWLINNPDIRERIARAGFNRVHRDGHDVVSRASYFLSMLNKPNQKNSS